MKVLIVDDEQIVVDIVKNILQRAQSVEIVVADSGEAALEIAQETAIDCAFIDMRMPGINGLETMVALKKVYPNCTMVMMTGYADEDSYKKALELKVTDYIYKPFDLEEFLNTIRRNLDGVEK